MNDDDSYDPDETLEGYFRMKPPHEVEFPDHQTGWEIHESHDFTFDGRTVRCIGRTTEFAR